MVKLYFKKKIRDIQGIKQKKRQIIARRSQINPLNL
jgi:hypothetical protein